MKVLKNIVSYSLIISLCLAPSLKAEIIQLTDKEKACIGTLKACDETLNKAQKVIDDQQKLIDIQKKKSDVLTKDLIKVQAEKDSIFRNPYLWLFIGSLLGGLTVGLTVRH